MRPNAIFSTVSAAAMLLSSAMAFAQVSTDNAYSTRVANNLNVMDGTISVGNTGARGGVNPSTGGGAICVNAYGFDAQGALLGCCSCLVPANGFALISDNNDLLKFVSSTPNSLMTKLLATVPVGGSCGAGGVSTATLAAGMIASQSMVEPSPFFTHSAVELEFTPSTLSASELAKLATSCTATGMPTRACNNSCGP